MLVKTKPKVVYWNNIPTPYLVDRFNALVIRRKLNFEAWFNDRTQSDRSWVTDESNWRFRYLYMPAIVVAGRRLHFPLPLLKRGHPDVLVSLYAEPSFLIGWTIAKLRGVKTGFRVLATFDSWIRRKRWKEMLKRYIFPRVDAIETVGRDGRDFAMRYGAPRDRIFFATHGIDVVHYRDSSNQARLKRSKLRKELGVVGITFIYVGRLLRIKGLDYLLDAFRKLQQRIESKVSLILVGDGADEEYLRYRCETEVIRDVIFVGFRQKNEIPMLYAVADVFVFPTLGDPYGLVVNEAMACALPIISTNAAGEIRDRIDEGVNGYIVPPGDSETLTDRMLRFVNNPELCKEMGRISAQKISGNTPERWAEDFERAINQILLRSPRSGI